MTARYGKEAFGFEHLEAYKAARAFRCRVYRLVKLSPPEEKYALGQQMRRGAVSLTNNIAEGYGRFTRQDATHFCRQARGSLMELVDDLNIGADERHAEARHLDDLRRDAD